MLAVVIVKHCQPCPKNNSFYLNCIFVQLPYLTDDKFLLDRNSLLQKVYRRHHGGRIELVLHASAGRGTLNGISAVVAAWKRTLLSLPGKSMGPRLESQPLLRGIRTLSALGCRHMRQPLHRDEEVVQDNTSAAVAAQALRRPWLSFHFGCG